MAKRTLIQILTAFLYNGNLPGFLNGRIWQGPSKSICVPGLNCYSCPGALGACPLGALQSSLSGVLLRFPFYVLGLMLLFGLLLGRTVCGWLCPFGFIHELLYKIPSPKFAKNKATRTLTKLKYIIGLLFVIILPIVFFYVVGVGAPAFCKYICPITVFLKPASYFSMIRIKCNEKKCIKCKKWVNSCPMNVDILDNSRKRKNGTECILCLNCTKNCPQKALHL